MKTHAELSTAKPLVVVVDDDPAVRNSLRFSLEVEGFAVREFSGGTELLTEAERSGACCLVIDEQMPGMTGLDTIARLRERNISVPTILMASRLTLALSERARRAAVSVVEKPLLDNALLEWIRGCFPPRSSTVDHRMPRASLPFFAGVLALALSGTDPTAAQDSRAMRGEGLLSLLCSRCHAVGRTDRSTHPEAPPFRTLGQRYPIEALAEGLAEGLSSGHPDMPEFRFEVEDVNAILNYLKSIQETRVEKNPTPAPR
jgi:cytochrome c